MSVEKTHRACSVWSTRGFSALDKGAVGEETARGRGGKMEAGLLGRHKESEECGLGYLREGSADHQREETFHLWAVGAC